MALAGASSRSVHWCYRGFGCLAVWVARTRLEAGSIRIRGPRKTLKLQEGYGAVRASTRKRRKCLTSREMKWRSRQGSNLRPAELGIRCAV